MERIKTPRLANKDPTPSRSSTLGNIADGDGECTRASGSYANPRNGSHLDIVWTEKAEIDLRNSVSYTAGASKSKLLRIPLRNRDTRVISGEG